MPSSRKRKTTKSKNNSSDGDDIHFIKKRPWTHDEEVALLDGVQKYGKGKWTTILRDESFWPTLRYRSNIDLKDKVNLN